MKKVLGALLALISCASFGATLVPIQLLNPAGSSAAQAIVSTGASSAPSWQSVALLSGATFTGTVQVSDAAPVMAINDTSGASAASLFFNNTGTGKWAWTNTSSTSAFTLGRYVAGTFTDNPISVSNSTGVVTMTDGISGSPISGSTGSFTTLSASSTVSGSGFSTYLASPPAIGGTAAAAGSFTTLSSTGTFTPSQTSGIVGTTTNNNANAGSVGEYISSTIASGSAISLTTGTPANVTSISLTAGDWDVFGAIEYNVGATTVVNVLLASASTTSATTATPFATGGRYNAADTSLAGVPIPTIRLSLSTTTTVYLVAQGNFTTSTLTAYGTIGARRRR